uniref:Bm10589 n=3 Tax=Brugia malayi TaxID=6279 RepID=A0A0I9N8M0_BRUMA|nr:Bm10589 [Brugia malayi]
MHRNIQRTILTPQFSYVQDFWFADSSEEKWLTYDRLSSTYMRSKIFKLKEEKKPYLLFLDIQFSFVMRIRNVDKMQVRTVNEKTPLGMFRALPRELLFSLFDWICANQLLSLSLTSSTFNGEVRRYLLTENARRRFLIETIAYMGDDVIEMDPFYTWGMLLKASTIVMDPQSRRSFLICFYCKNENITNWFGWGRCFMAFCEKWDFRECERLMSMILYSTESDLLLSKILSEEVGKYPLLEIKVRQRLQSLFLEHTTKDERDYGFWISAILRTQETTELQGKLFMIMFGPIKITLSRIETIDWEVLCNETINVQHICTKLLGSIARGIHHLMTTSNLGCYAWTDNQLSILMEEISMVPNRWALHNFAALLALNPQIIHIALFKRLSEGRIDEAAHIFHAVKTILHRWGIFVSGAVSDVMLKTFRSMSEINRRSFLSSVLKIESYQLSGLLLNIPWVARLMRRKTCEICQRAKNRHKTRKKTGIFWHSSRGLNRIDWRYRTTRKLFQKSSAMLVMRNNRHGTNEVDKHEGSKITNIVMRNNKHGTNEIDKQEEPRFNPNPRLQALIELFKKEDELEEVHSPNKSATILSEFVNDVEAVDDSLQPSTSTYVMNQISEAIPVAQSKSAEKPSLAHFKFSACFDYYLSTRLM